MSSSWSKELSPTKPSSGEAGAVLYNGYISHASDWALWSLRVKSYGVNDACTGEVSCENIMLSRGSISAKESSIEDSAVVSSGGGSS